MILGVAVVLACLAGMTWWATNMILKNEDLRAYIIHLLGKKHLLLMKKNPEKQKEVRLGMYMKNGAMN